MGRALLSHFISSRFITNAAKPAIILLVASCMSTNITNNQLSMYNPTTAHGAQTNYIEGMDISRHQGHIDWEQCTAARSGKAFVLIKATEGATYQDPMFLDNVKHASDAGFQLGAYHFLRFGSSSPSAQMENFIAQVKVAASLHREPSIVALDIEEHQGADYTLVSSVTEASVQYLKSNGMQPYIYTRTSFWDLYVPETPDIVKACPLWIARWRASPPLPRELPKGWNKWTIWQYTDKGSIPGITGNVDLNRMIAG